MRPPILKCWTRRSIEWRGIYVNRYGIGSQSTGGDSIPVEGDNYAFGWDGDFQTFDLKEVDGTRYRILLTGEPGAESIYIEVDPGPVIPVPIVPNYPYLGAAMGYQFTRDNYFRLLNQFYGTWHHVSAEANETHTISAGQASNAASSTDANTYNALFAFRDGAMSFFFKDLVTGNLYKPWIVENGVDTYQIELTAVP